MLGWRTWFRFCYLIVYCLINEGTPSILFSVLSCSLALVDIDDLVMSPWSMFSPPATFYFWKGGTFDPRMKLALLLLPQAFPLLMLPILLVLFCLFVLRLCSCCDNCIWLVGLLPSWRGGSMLPLAPAPKGCSLFLCRSAWVNICCIFCCLSSGI